MKISMGFWPTVAASVVAGGVLIYLQNKDAFNPVSENNLANQAFENGYEAVTGSDDAGGDFYTATHNEDGSVKWWAAPLWFLDRAGNLPDNGVGI